MDKINLNLYGLGYQKPVTKKEEESKPKEQLPVETKSASVSQEAMLSAMELSAAQNRAMVTGAKSMPDPEQYLDSASIARIQGSIEDFEKNMDKYTNIIDAEFGSALSASQKEALALQALERSI